MPLVIGACVRRIFGIRHGMEENVNQEVCLQGCSKESDAVLRCSMRLSDSVGGPCLGTCLFERAEETIELFR